jgi:transposase
VPAPKKYPDELRARAVRLYRESDPKPVIRQLVEQLNVHPEALRNWIRQDEADHGQRHDRPTTDMIEENRRLKRENAELKRVNEVLRAASALVWTGNGWIGSLPGGCPKPRLCIHGRACDSTPGPEAGAQCGSTARWDLCGGPSTRTVPTATVPFRGSPGVRFPWATRLRLLTETEWSG